MNYCRQIHPSQWHGGNFDGDEPLKDKTGRGNDGVEKGTVSYVDGLENLGNALSTADGYVSVAKVSDDLNLGTEDMSVGFWYKATNPGTWSAVLGDKNWSSGANPGFAVVQGQGQFYTTYAANGHSQQENIVSGTASKVYDGKWHYITAVLDRDGDSMLYVDGQMIASTSIASTADMDATVSTPFNIGADGVGGYRINSLIDEVKVYRSVLSQPEIEAEYLKNRDKTEEAIDDMVTQTEQYLENPGHRSCGNDTAGKASLLKMAKLSRISSAAKMTSSSMMRAISCVSRWSIRKCRFPILSRKTKMASLMMKARWSRTNGS